MKLLKIAKSGLSYRSQRRALPSKTAALAALGLLGLVGMALAAPDPSSDMLAGAFKDVSANFGPGSNFALITYAVEIIAGVGAYIKTKNLFSLVGLVVVMTFTVFAFTMITPAT